MVCPHPLLSTVLCRLQSGSNCILRAVARQASAAVLAPPAAALVRASALYGLRARPHVHAPLSQPCEAFQNVLTSNAL